MRQEGGGEVCSAPAAYMKPLPDELVIPEFARTESVTACWAVGNDMVAARVEQQYPESLDQHCPHVPRRVYPSRSWALAVKGIADKGRWMGVDMWKSLAVARRPCTYRLVVALPQLERHSPASGDPLRLRATLPFRGGSAVPAGLSRGTGQVAGRKRVQRAVDEPSIHRDNHAVLPAGPRGGPHRRESVRSRSFQGGPACGPCRPSVLG